MRTRLLLPVAAGLLALAACDLTGLSGIEQALVDDEVRCLPEPGIALLVSVRDEAGRPAATGTVVNAFGPLSDVGADAHHLDGLRIAIGDLSGTYSIFLARPGYRPVELWDVNVIGNECSTPWTRRIEVRLVPETGTPVRQAP